jgi:hypothetical protein
MHLSEKASSFRYFLFQPFLIYVTLLTIFIFSSKNNSKKFLIILFNIIDGSALFRAFLSREFSEENIEFWIACEEFKKARQSKMPNKARKIFDDFLAIRAPKEVTFEL